MAHVHTTQQYSDIARVTVLSSLRIYERYRHDSENAYQRTYYQGMIDGLRQCLPFINELSRDNLALTKAVAQYGKQG